ncbi:MAG: DoxX family protein [Ferruginibacter sp.]
MLRKISLYVMATFYFFAGVNHFIKPLVYKKMLPPFLPFHSVLNYASGFLELGFAILLVFPKTRNFASTGIIVLLIAFIPVHIYMLQTGWCPDKCLPEWVLWIRLIVLQPLLIYWAISVRKNLKNNKRLESV